MAFRFGLGLAVGLDPVTMQCAFAGGLAFGLDPQLCSGFDIWFGFGFSFLFWV